MNQVWGLSGCPHFYPLLTDRSVRFNLSVGTALPVSSGDQVSFNTTVGGGGLHHFAAALSIALDKWSMYSYPRGLRVRCFVLLSLSLD